jgi:hypothetical protein
MGSLLTSPETISLHVSSERNYTPEEWGEIITKAERILAWAGVYGPVRTEDGSQVDIQPRDS